VVDTSSLASSPQIYTSNEREITLEIYVLARHGHKNMTWLCRLMGLNVPILITGSPTAIFRQTIKNNIVV
jgi:hypothetical protein